MGRTTLVKRPNQRNIFLVELGESRRGKKPKRQIGTTIQRVCVLRTTCAMTRSHFLATWAWWSNYLRGMQFSFEVLFMNHKVSTDTIYSTVETDFKV
jgi:hypothetical protein